MGRGLTLAVSNGQTLFGLPDSFSFFGGGTVFGVSVPIIATVIVFTIMHFVLAHTVFGHEVYAIGGNREAARLAGINVRRVEMLVYTLAGGLSGFAGLVLTGRLSAAMPSSATGLELDVIAAVVFGGTSIFGGRGTILGTALGVLTIQLLKNGLQLTGVRGEGTVILIGSVLIVSILLNQSLEKVALLGRRLAKSKQSSTNVSSGA